VYHTGRLPVRTPLWWSDDIGPGDTNPAVTVVQTFLFCAPTGVFDNHTIAAVRGFQVGAGIPASGWVDEDTARALGPREQDRLLPVWFKGCDLSPGEPGYDVATSALGGVDGLKRFQGNNGLRPTGVIDADTARLLGALV
jgi:murein L,D-transpeptidase YcbB/YkuD